MSSDMDRHLAANEGGKELELLRLKMLSEAGYFDIYFESERCSYIPTSQDHCPGRISDCRDIQTVQGCRDSGGTKFSVLFYGKIIFSKGM
jgi:hypothetical protein